MRLSVPAFLGLTAYARVRTMWGWENSMAMAASFISLASASAPTSPALGHSRTCRGHDGPMSMMMACGLGAHDTTQHVG